LGADGIHVVCEDREHRPARLGAGRIMTLCYGAMYRRFETLEYCFGGKFAKYNHGRE